MALVIDPQRTMTIIWRIRNKHSGLYLTVTGYSKEEAAKLEQCPLQPTDDDNRASQLWFIFPVKDRRFLMTNMRSSLIMDVVGNSSTAGALIEQTEIMRSDNPNATQSWWISYKSGYLAIRNVSSRFYLSVVDSSTAPGAAIHQWTEQEAGPDRDAQLWAFEIQCTLPPIPQAILSVIEEGDEDNCRPTFAPHDIESKATAEVLIGQVVIPFPLINHESASMYFVLLRYGHWELVHQHHHTSVTRNVVNLELTVGLTSGNAEEVKKITGITVNSDGSLDLGEPMMLYGRYLVRYLKIKLKKEEVISDGNKISVPLYCVGGDSPFSELVWYRNDRYVLLNMHGDKVIEWTTKNNAYRCILRKFPDNDFVRVMAADKSDLEMMGIDVEFLRKMLNQVFDTSRDEAVAN